MRIALYARVSDARMEKDKDGNWEKKRQDPETQLLPLREYCKSREWEIVKVYAEEISAVKNRPQLKQMLRDAAMRKFDCLLVVKIDRIARSITDFVHIMLQLNSAGVRFIVLSQGIDTDQSNPGSRLLANMLMSVAEFERDLISERVKAGMARAKAQGKSTGGRPVVIVDKGKIDVLNVQGYSIREIAKQLKVNRGVVYQRLKELRKEKEK